MKNFSSRPAKSCIDLREVAAMSLDEWRQSGGYSRTAVQAFIQEWPAYCEPTAENIAKWLKYARSLPLALNDAASFRKEATASRQARPKVKAAWQRFMDKAGTDPLLELDPEALERIETALLEEIPADPGGQRPAAHILLAVWIDRAFTVKPGTINAALMLAGLIETDQTEVIRVSIDKYKAVPDLNAALRAWP